MLKQCLECQAMNLSVIHIIPGDSLARTGLLMHTTSDSILQRTNTNKLETKNKRAVGYYVEVKKYKDVAQ